MPRPRRATSCTPVGRDRRLEQAGGAQDDRFHRGQFVEIEAIDRAEAGAQRRGHQRQPRGCADERETRQLQADAARARPFADDDVQREIFHRRIEHLFHGATQAMHLVDEQDVALAQVGEDGRQIAGALDGRTRCDLQPGAHLNAQDMREGGLAEARRSVEQDMIQRLSPCARGLDQDAEILAQPVLAEHLGQRAWAQRGIYHDLFGPTLGRNRAFGHRILRKANQ